MRGNYVGMNTEKKIPTILNTSDDHAFLFKETMNRKSKENEIIKNHDDAEIIVYERNHQC